jgi:hypothetical protein
VTVTGIAGPQLSSAWTAVKLQFEVWPQTRCIRHSAVGAERNMSNSREHLVRKLLALRSRLAGYHPERHYMRGPGPMTLRKLGEAYRDATADDLGARIPDEWLTLVESIGRRVRGR